MKFEEDSRQLKIYILSWMDSLLDYRVYLAEELFYHFWDLDSTSYVDYFG